MTGLGGVVSCARRVLLALATAGALLVVGPLPSAEAHSGLISSSPSSGAVLSSAPETVRLTFNEPVNPLPAAFQLYDSGGEKRPLTVSAVDNVVTVQLPSDISSGTHVLGWRVVSADSHPIAGAVPFSIGAASGGATVLATSDGQPGGGADRAFLVAEVIGYLGLMAAVGLALFEVIVLRLSAAASRAREQVITVALAATIAAHVALVPLTFIRAEGAGLDRMLDLNTFVLGFSTAAGLALGLLVLGGCALLLTPVVARPAARVTLTALGTTLAVASVLAVGHTRTVAPTWLMMSTDVIHVLAGAMWFGGVIGLGMYLRTARRSGVAPGAAASTVARFSGVAGLLVLALAVTGTVMSVLVVGSAQELLATNYGRTLLVKVGFAAVIALLAVYNKLFLVPAVGRPQAPEIQWRRLHGAVRDETALLVAVLCVTGLLSMQSPKLPADSVSAPPEAARLEASLGSGLVQGVVKPARTGNNDFTFELRGADRKPLTPVSAPEVTATLPEAGLGPIVGKVQRAGRPGSYRATIALPLQGRWQVTVSARVSKFENPSAQQVISVAP